MEIGSYIELDLRSDKEYYVGDNVVRLNSARCGIYHCLRILNCDTVYLPYYECFTVRDFLLSKDIKISYYKISESFEPQINHIENNAAILIVNYFGVMGRERMKYLVSAYENVIIDNAQAFYSSPINECLNVYSPRKFFGVPDGCYVIGEGVSNYLEEYSLDYSSSTAGFLFERIEVGCNKAYSSRMKNEERIDRSNIMQMSKLTHALLKNEPYNEIKSKRINNFKYAHSLYKELNMIDPIVCYDDSCVPLIYPLVIYDDEIVEKLNQNQIYTGRWWNYLLNETEKKSFENKLSSYLIPIPIDQRYGCTELDYVYSTIKKIMK
ncbi:hypothetical protein Palpr_0953 [Paludibacter propionicigenes WB4]|uniref:DegT/DnrJ/EryC1/StrS aminotransferase n=2 Tax=Paludibacter TaxID=346096 RepID=E4T309_PALPW|nr:hypothetical protein Palpr_0953 [Paludibacter propionicigenes WB4]